VNPHKEVIVNGKDFDKEKAKWGQGPFVFLASQRWIGVHRSLGFGNRIDRERERLYK